MVSDPLFLGILTQDLKNGQHRNPANIRDYFTTAFFHHPDELQHEMQEAGFTWKSCWVSRVQSGS